MKNRLNRQEIERRLSERMPHLRKQYGLMRIALYGSFAAGRPTDQSDVDLLVEFSRPIGLEFVALADDLEAILGKKVHLATFESLRRSLDNPRRRPIALEIQRTLSDVCPQA